MIGLACLLLTILFGAAIIFKNRFINATLSLVTGAPANDFDKIPVWAKLLVAKKLLEKNQGKGGQEKTDAKEDAQGDDAPPRQKTEEPPISRKEGRQQTTDTPQSEKDSGPLLLQEGKKADQSRTEEGTQEKDGSNDVSKPISWEEGIPPERKKDRNAGSVAGYERRRSNTTPEPKTSLSAAVSDEIHRLQAGNMDGEKPPENTGRHPSNSESPAMRDSSLERQDPEVGQRVHPNRAKEGPETETEDYIQPKINGQEDLPPSQNHEWNRVHERANQDGFEEAANEPYRVSNQELPAPPSVDRVPVEREQKNTRSQGVERMREIESVPTNDSSHEQQTLRDRYEEMKRSLPENQSAREKYNAFATEQKKPDAKKDQENTMREKYNQFLEKMRQDDSERDQE